MNNLDGEYRICFEINASVNRKLKFLINLNVGDDEFSDDKKTTVQTQTNILGAKVKKFIHHARQFRKVQKMNKGQDKIIFEVFFCTKNTSKQSNFIRLKKVSTQRSY